MAYITYECKLCITCLRRCKEFVKNREDINNKCESYIKDSK